MEILRQSQVTEQQQQQHDHILINFWIKWLKTFLGRDVKNAARRALVCLGTTHTRPFWHTHSRTSHTHHLSFSTGGSVYFFSVVFRCVSFISTAYCSLVFVFASLVQLIIKLNCSVNIQCCDRKGAPHAHAPPEKWKKKERLKKEERNAYWRASTHDAL